MNEKKLVLIAEDEPALAQIIKESLETRDFVVDMAQDGEQVMKAFRNRTPDILVLDVMMPKKDGFTVAREIRKVDRSIPIVFLTARSQTNNVLEGFTVGGNDYLKKPFSMEELIARINNLLQRKDFSEQPEQFNLGNFLFDYHRQILQYKDEEKTILTTREADLLYHLYMNKNRILDRSPILLKLWGDDDFFSARSMDVFISKLRKKLSPDPNIQIINVRGYGYKLIC